MTAAALALVELEPDVAVPDPRPGPPLTLAMVDTYQRAWCRSRPACLRAVAAAASLDCRQCSAYTPLAGEELAAEIAGLCAIGRVLERLRAAPDVPIRLRRPTPRSRADGNRTVRPERPDRLDDASAARAATATGAAALELVESRPGVPKVDAEPIGDAADAVDVAAPGEAA